MDDMTDTFAHPWFMVPDKPLPMQLHSTFPQSPSYDMHGDKLHDGGELMGRFVRLTPSGRPKWKVCAMKVAMPCDPPAITDDR